MIGSFGKVTFFASADTIRTIEDFKRDSAGRWANHDVLGRKPVSQFNGPGLDKIGFKIRFDVRYGMNPRKEMDALLEMERSGQVATLIIGGTPVGVSKWKITSLSQSWTHIDNAGRVLIGEASLSLEEYT